MLNKRMGLLAELAKIMEVAAVEPETTLDPWDSMAWLVAQAAIDEVYGVTVDPRKLRDCVTVSDVLKLVE